LLLPGGTEIFCYCRQKALKPSVVLAERIEITGIAARRNLTLISYWQKDLKLSVVVARRN
jgi:hypothetical protein